MNSKAILDQEYFLIRGRILEVAAALDRIDRSSESPVSDPRYAKLLDALRLIVDNHDASRAEQMQLLLSREYDPDWRSKFEN